MSYLQKLGKAMMLPVACLPICGLLMGVGYFLCPSAMQGGEITGTAAHVGYFLITAGGALINHMALLFAIGVGVGLSEKNDGTGALAALVSWLIITTVLSFDTVTTLIPTAAEDETAALAFSKIQNPFIGILTGIIGATCYNRFKDTKLPAWLSFFSGKRSVAIVAGVVSLFVSVVLFFLWPLLFRALLALGQGIAGMGAFGAGLYAFLNRLLIPTGLHHALNNVFWFDTIGLGDLTHYWAGDTSADVSWSLGMYMSGFFPCMMFGIPGAALAVVRCARPGQRKKAIGIMLSCALCSFVCGVTEPFEFSFMFLAPVLYLIYALLYGLITFLVVLCGFRAGFCFSGGATDLVFSSTLPAAANTWMILPLGLLSFALFYGVFRFSIPRWDLKMPGREEDPENTASILQDVPAGGNAYTQMASLILRGLGGSENILSIDNCITRLRLELANASVVDEAVIKAAGASGVIRAGQKAVQVVIGPEVQFVADELNRLCATERRILFDDADIVAPADGVLIPMEEIPDKVFSSGMAGECLGIRSEDGSIYAPLTGEVTIVADTKHAIAFRHDKTEIVVHVGLDTVKMNGEGFRVFVEPGQTVEQGQKVMEADIAKIREHGYDPIVIVIKIP